MSAFQFASADLDPGAERWVGVAFAHHGDPQAMATAQAALAAYVGQKTPKQIFDTEMQSLKP